MHTKTIHLFSGPSVIDQIRPSHLRMVPCLIVVFTLVLSGMCRAEEKPLQMDAASETSTGTTLEGTPSPATEEKDRAALEELKTRKAALDMERTQLENEQAELADQGRRVRATRAIWRLNSDLKELSDRFAAHQEKRDAFEKDWDAYYSSLKDSPELEGLRERKAALDTERTQLEKEQAELAEQGRKVKNRREIRWHKHELQELNERIVAYQQKRDAFERDWDAFYSSQ